MHNRLKLLTGTYILRSTRMEFNQKNIEPTCLLSRAAIMNDFIVEYTLATIRDFRNLSEHN